MSHTLSNISSFAFLFVGLLLIFVILLQRGRGGGLAGAFGGAGGQSAFGSKAGDAFTRFTIYVAAVWVLLLMIEIKLVQGSRTDQGKSDPNIQRNSPPGEAN